MPASATPRPAPRLRGPQPVCVLWVLCASLLTFALPLTVMAQPPGSEASRAEDAKRLFSKGSELYLAKRYGEALESLTGSYKLMPSPNSGLIVARCLRELGQLVEAQEMFASVENEARRRAGAGEAKYARTADAAAAEGAAVRNSLGSIRVRVDGLEAGTKLEVDGSPTGIPGDGNVVLWHAPGEVAVMVRSATGTEQKQVVTVRAGTEIKMEFRGEPSPSATSPLPAPSPQPATTPGNPPTGPIIEPGPHPAANGDTSSGAGWAVPAAVVAGVLTAAGGGLFAGFGLASQSDYRDLKNRCATSCGSPSDHAEANTGSRYQTIADISLIAGGVAAVATLTFVIVAASNPTRKAASSAPLRLHIGAANVGLSGAFE
jgi:hypothetical protein